MGLVKGFGEMKQDDILFCFVICSCYPVMSYSVSFYVILIIISINFE